MQTEYTRITGEESSVYDKIDQYFNDIQRQIDSAYDNLLEINPDLSKHPHFERRTLGVRPLEFLEFDVSKALRPDDHIFMLLYKDKVVATVTEQRNGFNYVQFSFFSRLEEILGKAKEKS